MEFRSAKCPSCGGELQVPIEKDVVKCMYCGNDINVGKAITETSAANVSSLLTLATTAMDGNNYEEANSYFTKILEVDEKSIEAWIGKGVSAVMNATRANQTYGEAAKIDIWNELKTAEVYFKKAEQIEPDNNSVEDARGQVNEAVVKFLMTVAMAEFNHAMETYNIYADDFIKAINHSHEKFDKARATYIAALKLKPYDVEIMKSIVTVNTKFPGQKFEKDLIKKLIAQIKQKEPDYVDPSKGSCFVATATYGNPFAPEVVFLRAWRDNYLNDNIAGKVFVRLYYRYSPPLAKWISKSEKRMLLSRLILDKITKYLRRKIQ